MAVLLKAKGLYTFENELNVAEGALQKADNVVIDDHNVIQPRRGFSEYGDNFATASDVLKQVTVYKDRILRHYESTLQFDSDGAGTFSAFDGSYSELVSGLRMKFLETQGNLYFTTDEGIKKISATSASGFTTDSGYITDAGGVKALDVQGQLKFTTGGILPSESKVGYRIVWGITDNNNNVVYGSPSSRLVMTNSQSDNEVSEVSQITTTAYASIAASDYILLNSTTENYFIWFNVGGSDSEPQTSETINKTPIEININGLTTNDQVSAFIANAVGALDAFDVEVSTSVVTITNNVAGDVDDIAEQSAGITGISVATITDGDDSSQTPANIDMTFTVPQDITTIDYFYQIFRTGIVTASTSQTVNDIDPGDEMNLIYESGITSTEITAGEVEFTDDIIDSFRESGLPLYTSPNIGEARGILEANERPPIAKDVALFRNSTFYANTKTSHSKQFNLLSVSGFTSKSSQLIIGNSTTTREYTFVGATQIQRVDTVADVADSLDGTHFLLNSARNENQYYVWFTTGAGAGDPAVADRVGIRVDISTGDANTAVATTLKTILDSHDDFSASVSTNQVTITWAKNGNTDNAADGDSGFTFNAPSTEGDGESLYGTITAITATNPAQVTITGHGLENSDVVYISDSDSGVSIDGEQTITYIDANTFSVPIDNTPGAGGSVGSTGEMWQTDVLLSSLTSASQSIDESARSLVKVINRDDSSPVYAFYISGATDLPGIILLENRDLTDEAFYIGTNDSAITGKFSPELSDTQAITNISIADPTQVTSASHGLVTGDEVYVYNTDSAPELMGKYEVTVLNSNVFTVDVNVTTGGTSGLWFLADVASDNLVKPNRIYFSKPDQPEAVPILNYRDIGTQDDPIERIVALRDNLFVFKTDGVYIVTGFYGTDGSGWSDRMLDDSTVIIAPDSAAVLNNVVYCLTTQGVVEVTEGTPGIISRPLEDEINRVTNSGYNFRSVSFGVGYEKDRAYLLWLPDKESDVVGTQCFRFNTITRAWTRWTKQGTCGIVNLDSDRLYVGAGDTNYLLEERKGLDRTDYCDRDFTVTIQASGVSRTNVSLNTVTDVEIGDVLLQTQYVTAHQVNKLLLKLDIDSGLDDTDYYSTIALTAGDNLKTQLDALNTKLVSDDASGTITPTTFSADFATAQTEFNTMIGELNNAACDTAFKNYAESSGTNEYEGIITAIDVNNKIVTLNFTLPFLETVATMYKGYSVDVIWKPQHFGDPAALKQVREGSIIFDQNTFYSATIAYASDLNPSFVEQEFCGNGNGYFGANSYGLNYFGGAGNDLPIRTYVPLEKMRCRYLTCRFKHQNAREEFKILGISMEPRLLSKRAYR